MRHPAMLGALFFAVAGLCTEAQSFKNPKQIPVAGSTGSCCLVDLNKDGKLDLVVAGTSTVTVLLGQGGGNFKLSATYPLNGTTSGGATAVVGDINGDGKLDIVLVADGSDGYHLTIFTLLGNGDGTFAAPVAQTVYAPKSIAPYSGIGRLFLGDLNSDGIPDLIVPMPQGDMTYVALGDGKGNFTFKSTPISTAGTYYGFAVADFNGDGKFDYLEPFNASFRLYLGNGDGTFGTPTVITQPTGNYTYDFLVTDINKDGSPDIVYTYNGTVYILTNQKNGTFVTTAGAIGSTASLEAVVDVNGDGIPDLVTSTNGFSVYLGKGGTNFGSAILTAAPQGSNANPGGWMVGDLDGTGVISAIIPGSTKDLVFVGNGDGTFQSVDLYNTGETAQGVNIADFNGDGHPDIAVAVQGVYPRMLLGNGKGTFQLAADQNSVSSTLAYTMGIGDFNGDGKPDLVQVGTSVHNVLLGNGDGTFAAPVADAYASLLIGDFNGDGRSDMLSEGYNSATGNTFLDLEEGQKNGTFASVVSIPVGLAAQYFPYSAGDYNGDGRIDSVLLSSQNAVPQSLLGNGDGTFKVVSTTSTGHQVTRAFSADLDGDGNLDLFVESQYGDYIYYGLGNGTFAAPVLAATTITSGFVGGVGVSVHAVDMDGDGKLDLVYLVNGTSSVSTGYVEILHNLGNRTFGNPSDFLAGYAPVQLDVADLNGDGYPDIVVADNLNAVSVLLNLGATTGTAAVISTSPEPSYIGLPFTTTVTVTGKTLTATPTGGVSFTFDGLSFGSAPLVNGTASASYTPQQQTTIGPHTITVQYSGDAIYTAVGFTSQHTIALRPVPVTVTLAANPTSALKSQTIRLVATLTGAQDSLYTPMVTFADNGQNLGSSTLVGGIAQLDTNLLSVGNHSITATYIGLSNNFTGIIYPVTTSAPVSVAISAVPTTTVLASSATTVSAGAPVTLSAAVSSATGAPFGSVTFYDGQTVLGTSLLVQGTAIWVTPLVAGGTHPLSGVYNSNETYSASSSAPVVVTASASRTGALTSLALAVMDPGPGANLQLTAVLASTSASTSLLSQRTIAFYDSGLYLGSASSSASGIASLSVARFTGSHNFHAAVVADNDVQAFDSPPLQTNISATSDYAIQVPLHTVTVRGGEPVMLDLQLNTSGNFISAIAWSCITTSPTLSCAIATGAGQQPVLTLSGNPSIYAQNFAFGRSSLFMAVIVFLSVPGKRRRRPALAALCVALCGMSVLSMLAGCGANPVRLSVVTVHGQAISGSSNLVHEQQLQVVLAP